MAQVLIRDLDDEILQQLKAQAARNHRSLQGELHAIVTRAAAVETGHEAITKRLEARSPRAQYTDSTSKIREHRDGVRNDLIPGNGRRRNGGASSRSVWNWLKRRAAGNMSKQEIDEYIRAERESWGLP